MSSELKVKLFKDEKSRKKFYDIYDDALSQLPIDYKTSYIETTYGNTHIIRCGKQDGKKLVLLHCMGFSSVAWLPYLESLSDIFDIYCIDSIGEPGRTISNTNKITLNDYMEWLNQVIDKAGFERVYMAGWSFGGFLATGYAIAHPEKVEKVIALSPAATISPLVRTFHLKLFPALLSGKDKKINAFLKWICGQDNTDFPNNAFSVFTEGIKSFRGWATGVKLRKFSEDEFRKIEADYYLLIGGRDPIYKAGQHEKIAADIRRISPRFQVEILDATHGFPLQQVEETCRRMIRFL